MLWAMSMTQCDSMISGKRSEFPWSSFKDLLNLIHGAHMVSPWVQQIKFSEPFYVVAGSLLEKNGETIFL